MSEYEYGIAWWKAPYLPRQDGMTLSDAMEWLDEWEGDGGKPGLFVLIRREIGPWGLAPEKTK